METAVRELERTQAASNGRVRELPRDADPSMTREARAERAAWRRAHPEVWRAGLESLVYFDPDYGHDPGHEYEDDWTTDPDHAGDGIEFAEYNEDGVLEPIDDRRMMLEGIMLPLLRKLRGNRAESQGRLYFPGSVAARLKLRTRRGNRSSYVKPDLMVFPPAFELPADAHRERPDCALRMHEGAPPPELVVEILSVSSVARDYGVKMRMYALLGVAEYWICDVGGIRAAGSPVELQVFRLTDAGDYAPVAADWGTAAGELPEAPAFWSAECGAHVRLIPGAYAPRFQWWDAVQGRWRDTETDAQDERERIRQESRQEGEVIGEARGVVIGEKRGREEGLVEGRQEGEAKVAIAALDSLLTSLASDHREQIAERWRADGPPEDVMDRILAARQMPDAWRALLLPAEPDKGGIPDPTPAPPGQ